MLPRENADHAAVVTSNPLAGLPSWALSRAAARAHRIVQERLTAAGFSGYEYRVLAALTERNRRSQTDIGKAALLDGRDVTHTVRALQDRGLVSRSTDSRDTRVALVELTAEGRRSWSRLVPVMEDAQRALLAPLSPPDAEQFARLLFQLHRSSEPTHPDSSTARSPEQRPRRSAAARDDHQP